jgi:hypothetical protein
MMGGQHSAEFVRLVERRRKFVDGLDANKGEINLDIFEDFYPDKAHFVYELLQNAEDAGATEITFTLTPEKLVCEHNGRAFTLADVTSITGLHDSTKANAQDKIGKFGVGFKSVFGLYTGAVHPLRRLCLSDCPANPSRADCSRPVHWTFNPF